MANVIRIFVEKREGFDVEARQMLAAYDEYCEKLRAYGEKLFEETFAFYDDIPKQEVHKKEKRHE